MNEESSGYRFLEHTTDLEIEAFGKNLEQAFENAGKAIEDTMVDLQSIGDRESKEIIVRGKDLESLLYAWIESLITVQETEGLLFSKFNCRIFREGPGFELRASLSGEKFLPAKHEQKTAIKAPTFHGMKIVESAENVMMRFLVDL